MEWGGLLRETFHIFVLNDLSIYSTCKKGHSSNTIFDNFLCRSGLFGSPGSLIGRFRVNVTQPIAFHGVLPRWPFIKLLKTFNCQNVEEYTQLNQIVYSCTRSTPNRTTCHPVTQLISLTFWQAVCEVPMIRGREGCLSSDARFDSVLQFLLFLTWLWLSFDCRRTLATLRKRVLTGALNDLRCRLYTLMSVNFQKNTALTVSGATWGFDE